MARGTRFYPIWKPEELDYVRRVRHRARTDLIYLAREILGYDKVVEEVHRPMVSTLAQFTDYQGEDVVRATQFDTRGEISQHSYAKYTPIAQDPSDVFPRPEAGKPETYRNVLILDPRGWFKTTLNCISHTIQIILNFPSTSIHIVHANGEISQDIVGYIKDHFIDNWKMRYAFPEFCTAMNENGSFRDIGTKSQFIIPARQKPFNAPTVSSGSIISTAAGKHFHWIKFTDIVTEQNYMTPDSRAKVASTFFMYHNLLIAPHYFVDVEGTCYHFEDVYNDKIIDRQLKLPEDERFYRIFLRGSFRKVVPEGETEKFIPEERDWPYLMRCPDHPESEGAVVECDVEGCKKKRQPTSYFPTHNSTEALMQLRAGDEFLFAAQKLNDPSKATGDDHPFPRDLMVWVPKPALDQVKFRFFTLTIDTAEEITKRSDYTAITVVGWSDQNRAYLVDAVQGRFNHDKILEYAFQMYSKWRCTEWRWEKSSFNRGFQTAFYEKCRKTGIRVNMVWIDRDNRTSKAHRISTLQPFYRSGDLRFSRGLNPYVQDQLIKQFERFGSGHDDLLDALSDQFQNRILGEPERPKSEQEIMNAARDTLIQRAFDFDRIYGEERATTRQHTGAL